MGQGLHLAYHASQECSAAKHLASLLLRKLRQQTFPDVRAFWPGQKMVTVNLQGLLVADVAHHPLTRHRLGYARVDVHKRGSNLIVFIAVPQRARRGRQVLVACLVHQTALCLRLAWAGVRLPDLNVEHLNSVYPTPSG